MIVTQYSRSSDFIFDYLVLFLTISACVILVLTNRIYDFHSLFSETRPT